MKVSLVVTQGVNKGRAVPVKLPQFLIGRDPQCQLRPASPMISRRHCGILVKGTQVFLRDFGSTNGTLVNGKKVSGEIEIRDGDVLKIDPLEFQLKVEGPVAENRLTPQPSRAEPEEHGDEESIAALLLDLKETGPSPDKLTGAGDEVPTGTTIMQVLPAAEAEAPVGEAPKEDEASGDHKQGPSKGGDKKGKAAPPDSQSTSVAAKALLDKYTRRKKT